jgi:cytochrome c-type biogenesis protein CcmH/NrfG
MASDSTAQSVPSSASSGLPGSRVYPLAGAALLLGLGLGYFGIGAKTAPNAARTAAAAPAAKPTMPGGHPMPTMEQMKAMADVKAAPLLEKLKTSPKDAKLLAQVGALYAGTHQFKDAATYYTKSLQVDPKNVTTRTDLASTLYYSGDVDGALNELQLALKQNPSDVNALFNLGMIKYRGKDDAAGAIAAWQQLLKTHPDLDRKAAVEQLIAEAKEKSSPKN